MTALGQPADPPYLRIAAELRTRIASGELRAGEKVPSTRRITQEWGVAMATATKALVVLRQEGLVRAVPGVGTVVHAPDSAPEAVMAVRARRHGKAPRGADPSLTSERVVRTAVAVADAQGSAGLSMRAIAGELGVSTMALYRHVPGKAELVELMADAVFGDVALPAQAPAHWRGRLEASARLQWALYRRHPWLAKVMSFTRPLISPNALALMEWTMDPVRELGLSANELLHVTVSLAGFVRGVAVNLEDEALAEQDTGLTDEEWMEVRSEEMGALISSGHYPMYERILADPEVDFSLDTMFDFGLARLLDGLTELMHERRPRPVGRGCRTE